MISSALVLLIILLTKKEVLKILQCLLFKLATFEKSHIISIINKIILAIFEMLVKIITARIANELTIK